MLLHPLHHIWKFALLGAVFLVTSGMGFCAESNQVQKAAAPQVLEKNTPSKLFRPYLPSNPFSESTKFQALPNVPAAPTPGAPPPGKRGEEKLDRQKNWIFAKPDDREKSESVEEIFGVGKIFENQKSRGVVNEFLSGQVTAPKVPNEKELNSFSVQPNLGVGNQLQERNGFSSQGNLIDPSREKKISGFTAEQTKLSEMWRERFGANGERRREERDANMKEFENLFRPPNNVAAAGNGLNVLGQNGQPAATARSANDRFNPALPASSADNFRTAPRVAPGANGLERPDINARVFGPTATPPPVEIKKVERPPVVLPVPKRKF